MIQLYNSYFTTKQHKTAQLLPLRKTTTHLISRVAPQFKIQQYILGQLQYSCNQALEIIYHFVIIAELFLLCI